MAHISMSHTLMLLYKIINRFFKIYFPEHKLVMVGLDNAGKTTILYQFLMNEVVQTSPTIGSNVEEVRELFFFKTLFVGKSLKLPRT